MNIAEILKNAIKGTKLYSLIFGEYSFEKIVDTTLYTQQHLIEYDNRPCYLVKDDYVGKDTDGQPLINNISIIEKIDGYRVKEEKQHKEKPTEEVEPKFKVGDWIVLEDSLNTYKIVEVYKSWYKVISNNNGMEYYSIGFYEEDDCRLWTIHDAKDGDVLVNKDECIFIYNPNTSKYPTLRSYCYLSIQGNFLLEDYDTGSWLYADEITPATKEQCDFLFARMKEAGYKWDGQKKELKKIESKSVQSEEFKQRIEDIIRTLMGCVIRLSNYGNLVVEDTIASLKDDIEWFKSLKNRD